MRNTFAKTLAVLMMLTFAVLIGCSEPPVAETTPSPDESKSVAKKKTERPQVSGGPVIGEEAPEIEGVDLDGVEFKLSDYRGKVVMLDFYGDW